MERPVSSENSVVVVDTGLGNFGSLRNMCKRIGLGVSLSYDRTEILRADRLILPGVGSFDEGMRRIHERDLAGPLSERVAAGTPVLGICLGMQLMTKGSEEGSAEGLGWIDAETRRLPASDGLRVPHMGWNAATPARHHSLFHGVDDDSRYYFVHSYYVDCADDRDVLAWTEYGIRFASAIDRKTLVATQFHPEKSHRFGLAVLRNFLGTP